tara:strand:- start:104 stop:775 length:672 start_codon:yes stop_codon:yes gene_type:complete
MYFISSPWTPLRVKEWDDEQGREADGFVGRDFVHSSSAAARVLQYYLLAQPAAEKGGAAVIKLRGTVKMTPAAESHRGLCHGGSMTALMDDVVGWTGFCASGACQPWSGFTAQVSGAWLRRQCSRRQQTQASPPCLRLSPPTSPLTPQINTKLCAPIAVGADLVIEGDIERREGRKCFIKARLISDAADTSDAIVHCTCEGLFIIARTEAKVDAAAATAAVAS